MNLAVGVGLLFIIVVCCGRSGLVVVVVEVDVNGVSSSFFSWRAGSPCYKENGTHAPLTD